MSCANTSGAYFLGVFHLLKRARVVEYELISKGWEGCAYGGLVSLKFKQLVPVSACVQDIGADTGTMMSLVLAMCLIHWCSCYNTTQNIYTALCKYYYTSIKLSKSSRHYQNIISSTPALVWVTPILPQNDILTFMSNGKIYGILCRRNHVSCMKQ